MSSMYILQMIHATMNTRGIPENQRVERKVDMEEKMICLGSLSGRHRTSSQSATKEIWRLHSHVKHLGLNVMHWGGTLGKVEMDSGRKVSEGSSWDRTEESERRGQESVYCPDFPWIHQLTSAAWSTVCWLSECWQCVLQRLTLKRCFNRAVYEISKFINIIDFFKLQG